MRFANHKLAQQEAREILANFKISSLPVNPFFIIDKLRITLIPYSENLEQWEEVVTVLRHKKCEAITTQDPVTGDIFIRYDDNHTISEERKRFTIAHEIGHACLDHIYEFKQAFARRGGYIDKNHPAEKEADSFAGELLRPPVLLALVKAEEIDDIQTVCKISYSAAKVGSNKTKAMKKYMFNSYKNEIDFYSTQFHDFIHQKHCLKCHNTFVHDNANYCPICGNNSIIWGGNTRSYINEFFEEVINMNYFSRELDQNSKAITCPKCENESINPDGNYCQICGTYLVNECWGKTYYNDIGEERFSRGCDALVEGDARYCSNCGSHTTFFRDELLPNWEDEFNASKNIKEDEEDILF